VSVCPLAQLDRFSPRKLVTDLALLPLEEVLEKHNIWECLTCGQCSVYCPMTTDKQGVKIPELILELRQLSKDSEEQVERMAQCETHDDIFPIVSRLMVENPSPPDKLGFIKENNLKTSTEGPIAYFVGCLPLMEDIIFNFEVNYTNTAKSVIGLLNEAEIEPVVLNEKCCGHDILWGKADEDTFKKLAEYNIQLYRDAGVKTVITSCAEGYRTWKIDYPKVIEDFDFEVLHISEFLLREKILEHIRFPSEREITVTYHDACRIGRFGPKLYEAPREILRKIPGVELIEMKNIKEDALCCGVSAFSCCNEYTRIIRQLRLEDAAQTGAEYLIVPCPKCLTHFNCFLTEPSVSKKKQQLKEKIKVVDFSSFIGELLYLI